MKKIAIIMAAALTAATASAREWTLDECVDYAVAHNIDVARQRLNADNGEIAVTASKDAFLPNVSGYASQGFSFGRGLTADNTYVNRNTSSFSMGASMSLPLFQGLRAVQIGRAHV